MKIGRSAAAGSLESSDAMVTISPGEGMTVEIESVVMKQFGPAIEAAVRQELARQGVEDALVRVQDKGALECTIRARVETAILRAGEVKA
ncbi:MAG TPA: citrate lyase acyl carrier protein [Candidatus Excrementavichristensenella intestinipullorum]|nr:citrate lyase acyl carrier protein [Candidatus Excrementavichristensenella intestinipullorum]